MVELLFRETGAEEWKDSSAIGIRMGDGFIEALETPCPIKEPVANTSRREHGRRVVRGETFIDTREITLTFRIIGKNRADLLNKKAAFVTFLYKQWIDIQVPSRGTTENPAPVYHLRYTGKNVTFGMDLTKTTCQISAKFEEYNPYNRT